jgi:flagellin-like protein
MKKTWIIRKDSEAVSPVIATILMVAITVVLAAVLYVMVLGFGGTSSQTPVASYQKTTITYGQKIGVISIAESDIPWDDVKIQVSDGTNIIEFVPLKANHMTTAGHNYTPALALGSITGVACVLTDVSGNGYVSGSDYFTVKYQGAVAFSSTTQYSAVLLYEPSGERCGQPISFTG